MSVLIVSTAASCKRSKVGSVRNLALTLTLCVRWVGFLASDGRDVNEGQKSRWLDFRPPAALAVRSPVDGIAGGLGE